MIRGTNKSKRFTMMRVTNGIVAAFVAVLLCNSQYHHDGVGMVAAATLGGGEEEVLDTTTRDTMMTAVLDGEPAPTRRLKKRSKASTPDATEGVERLVRIFVFTTMVDVYRSMQLDGANRSLQPSSSAAAVARSDTGVFDGLFSGIKYTKYSCDGCIDFYEWALTFDQTERRKFCRDLHKTLVADRRLTEWWQDLSPYYTFWRQCEEVMVYPSRTDYIPFPTPTTACQQTGWCPDQYDICHLNEKSGSTENYMIQAENKAACDRESTSLGCGNCKDEHTSYDVIGGALPVPSDGFATYCQGGPCVWKTQTRQCMGLNYYSAFTTPEACADACCGDYRCAVWQFSGSGHVNQCWYGANCDTLGNYNWVIGGIRPMPQAPECEPYGPPQTNYIPEY